MSSSLNRVTLIGNAGKDPEVRSTQSGAKVMTINLATTEKYTVKSTGEVKEATEWHRVVIWAEGLIDVLEKYVQKGTMLFVEGKLQTRSWEKDGEKKYSTEVVVQGFGGQVKILRNGRENPAGGAERAPAKSGGGSDLDDEIPF